MKKLLLSLLFLSAFASIKTESSPIINETNAINEPMIVQDTFGKQPKSLLDCPIREISDFSIREIWERSKEKVLSFIQNKTFFVALLGSFSAIQAWNIYMIAQKMMRENDFFDRLSLFRSLETNVALLIVPHMIFAGCSMIDLIVG
jgi:hypothetical protein